MKLIKSAVSITLLASLAACGGGTSEITTTPAIAKACDAVFFQQVSGSYNGRIEYRSADWVEDKQACAWEVSMSVFAQEYEDACDVGFHYQSDVVTGDCAELSTSGEIHAGITLDESNPQWPMELAFRTNQVTDVFSTYALGNVNVGGWESVFDGRGNVSTDQVSELDGWSGVLVRFSDQPFQDDDGSIEVEGYEND